MIGFIGDVTLNPTFLQAQPNCNIWVIKEQWKGNAVLKKKNKHLCVCVGGIYVFICMCARDLGQMSFSITLYFISWNMAPLQN